MDGAVTELDVFVPGVCWLAGVDVATGAEARGVVLTADVTTTVFVTGAGVVAPGPVLVPQAVNATVKIEQLKRRGTEKMLREVMGEVCAMPDNF
ncbi:hypothetical protein V3G39_12210 [Dermatophilaceae bacterium Sec6.4]